MESSTRKRADELLEASLAERGLADARPAFRALLRDLKAHDGALYDRAVSHYSDHVVPALLDGSDAVQTWIDYGRYLGQMAETGDLMAIDVTGRATRYEPKLQPGDLVLFVPDGGRNGAFVVVSPADLSAAQSATVDLLVEGKLALQ